MLRMGRVLSVVAGLLLLSSVVTAEVRLAAIFADHMVLQRDKPVNVWGWAEPGEAVSIAIADQRVATTASAAGDWQATLQPLAAGGPHVLKVTGSNTVSLQDVLVGEVWLCSGQSNMAMTVNRAQDFEAEQQAAKHPTIRMFRVNSHYALEPARDCTGNWTVCTPVTVAGFSATAYFFARELQKTVDVPIGLINSSVGGTPIEAWIPAAAQRGSAELAPAIQVADAARAKFDPVAAKEKYEADLAKWKEAVKAARTAGKAPPRGPQDPVVLHTRSAVGGLYNGMIAPVVRYTFRGALWYQGEANSTEPRAHSYQHQLPLLVTSWRAENGQGDFPFAWVQLPNFQGVGRNWPLVREAMLDTLYLPHTGMAVTIDIGEAADIHPKNKQAVGQRLALWATSEVYAANPDAQKLGGGSPALVEHEIDGNQVRVTFSFAGDQGLSYSPFEPSLTIAAISGSDGVWHPATIVECEGDAVTFSASAVAEPVALRYLWANNPVPAIRNGAGIPASPFRTDDLEAVVPFDVPVAPIKIK